MRKPDWLLLFDAQLVPQLWEHGAVGQAEVSRALVEDGRRPGDLQLVHRSHFFFCEIANADPVLERCDCLLDSCEMRVVVGEVADVEVVDDPPDVLLDGGVHLASEERRELLRETVRFICLEDVRGVLDVERPHRHALLLHRALVPVELDDEGAAACFEDLVVVVELRRLHAVNVLPQGEGSDSR